MSVFRVRALRGGAEFDIETVAGEGQAPSEHILYSPGLQELYTQGQRLFGALLVDTGGLLQAFGPIFYYRSIHEDDIRQFALSIDPVRYRSKGISAALSAHPETFISLFRYADKPRSMIGQEEMQYCRSRIDIESMDFGTIPEDLMVEKEGRYFRIREKESESEESNYPRSYTVVGDEERGEAWLYSFLPSAYRRGREKLESILSFPEEPEFKVGMTMLIALRDLLDFTTDFEYIEEAVEPPVSEEHKAFTERLNRALRRMQQAEWEGTSIDEDFIKELAEEEDLDPTEFSAFKNQLDEKLNREQTRKDFFGLTPAMMHKILYKPVHEIPEIVELRAPESIQFGDSVLLDSAAALLKILAHEGPIKEVYASRNLPKDVVQRFSRRSVRGEESLPNLHLARTLLEIAGPIDHSSDYFRLSEQGLELFGCGEDVESIDTSNLYLTLLHTFMSNFNWAYLHGDKKTELPLLQASAVFLLHTARTLSRISARRVNQVFLQAFPDVHRTINEKLAEEFGAGPVDYEEAASITEEAIQDQFIMQLLLMFGLAETEKAQKSVGPGTVLRKTALFDEVFDWKVPAF